MADEPTSPLPTPRRWGRIISPAEQMWGSFLTGWLLWTILAIVCTYWRWHTPSPGKAVAWLAVTAAIMSVREGLSGFAKFSWIILLFGFLLIEVRAIDKDRQDARDQQAKILKEERDSFKAILDQGQTNFEHLIADEGKNFRQLLRDQQSNFAVTISHLLHAERQQTREFRDVLTRQQQLFKRQEQVAEFLNGKLLPASDPMPETRCGQIAEDDTLVMVGTNAFVTNRFPHTILMVHEKPVISIDRTETGSLALSVDVRGADNKVVFRLDRNGFRTTTGIQMLRPDQSSVIFENEYGEEMFRARFLNTRALLSLDRFVSGVQIFHWTFLL